MKIVSKVHDARINASNILVEMTFGEYLKVAKAIIANNEFQRRRVKASATVYSLLKHDLKEGCIIPPIVLAFNTSTQEIDIGNLNDEKFHRIILENTKNLLILDGLQRTHTLIDLDKELEASKDEDLKIFYDRILRAEIYVGINKIGILYRMLTLNTGQTPMSIRHQVEILYSDYLNIDLGGIKLFTEREGFVPANVGEYNFKDMIEGFNSYLERDELTIDRQDLLDNIKSLEKLSKENQKVDVFLDFVKTYNKMVERFAAIAPDWQLEIDKLDYALTGPAFGTTSFLIFSKSQVMTGFGCAIGKLIDQKAVNKFQDIDNNLDALKFDSDVTETLNDLIIRLDKIRLNAKKIGNDQRMFFHYFFRELFDSRGEAFLKIQTAISEAYKTYERKTQ